MLPHATKLFKLLISPGTWKCQTIIQFSFLSPETHRSRLDRKCFEERWLCPSLFGGKCKSNLLQITRKYLLVVPRMFVTIEYVSVRDVVWKPLGTSFHLVFSFIAAQVVLTFLAGITWRLCTIWKLQRVLHMHIIQCRYWSKEMNVDLLFSTTNSLVLIQNEYSALTGFQLQFPRETQRVFSWTTGRFKTSMTSVC